MDQDCFLIDPDENRVVNRILADPETFSLSPFLVRAVRQGDPFYWVNAPYDPETDTVGVCDEDLEQEKALWKELAITFGLVTETPW